jgi:hypothetical protein
VSWGAAVGGSQGQKGGAVGGAPGSPAQRGVVWSEGAAGKPVEGGIRAGGVVRGQWQRMGGGGVGGRSRCDGGN